MPGTTMATGAERTMRTFTARNGRVVQSPYTDLEATERLKVYVEDGALVGDFPRSLASIERVPSAAQLAWIHILVVEHERKNADGNRGQRVVMPSLDGIRDLFDRARGAGLERPKVRMEIPAVGRVQISIAGARSRTPGHLVVTDGGGYGERVYYGRIDPTPGAQPDVFYASHSATPGLVGALVDIALDPVGTAKAYGHVTGQCCFCGLPLTDGRSIAVGYGPICAENWGLPWGDVSVDTERRLV